MSGFITRRLWMLLGACAMIGAAVLAVMPEERTIGQVVKIVYLHGALSRAGLVGFAAAGVAALAYFARSTDRLSGWSMAFAISGWLFWTAHFLVSMPATHLTWGPWIAWGEPRVTMSLQVIGAGLIVQIITWMLGSPRFAAGANLLLSIAVSYLAAQTGVFLHPLDPIRSSPSSLFQLTYLALLIPVISSMVLVAWRIAIALQGATGRRAASQFGAHEERL